MRVVVGLRNPGAEYAGTRHNLGAQVVDAVVDRRGLHWRRGPLRTRCQVAATRIDGEPVLFALPLSYMNESGGPVSALLDYHGAEPADLLVVHDDIDLAFGRLRIQFDGGSGGHNGIRSVQKALGTPDFTRLKVGVGRPPEGVDPADYVLSPFSRAERSALDSLIEDAADVVETWLVDPERARIRAAERK
jgi:PTH1 family peptidyl-tRNA hydrolase